MLINEISDLLKCLNLTIATAESATGGRIADELTNVPGSSSYFLGSVVAYDNDIKNRVLGVSHNTLNNNGAVSKATAIAMAKGIRTLMSVDLGLSTTGIAGPAGARPQKPVGLIYVAIASSRRDVCIRHTFTGKREENKQAFTKASLELLKAELTGWSISEQ